MTGKKCTFPNSFRCGHCGVDHELADRDNWPSPKCGELFDQRLWAWKFRELRPETAREHNIRANLHRRLANGDELPFVIIQRDTGEAWVMPGGSFRALTPVPQELFPRPTAVCRLGDPLLGHVVELITWYNGPAEIIKACEGARGSIPRESLDDPCFGNFVILGLCPWLTWWIYAVFDEFNAGWFPWPTQRLLPPQPPRGSDQLPNPDWRPKRAPRLAGIKTVDHARYQRPGPHRNPGASLFLMWSGQMIIDAQRIERGEKPRLASGRLFQMVD